MYSNLMIRVLISNVNICSALQTSGSPLAVLAFIHGFSDHCESIMSVMSDKPRQPSVDKTSY